MTKHTEQQRVGRNISSHALPNTNNPPMGSSVSQEQIKQLTSMYMEQQRQHQQLIKDLNRVFVAGSPYGVDNAQTPSLSAALKEKGIMEPLHLTSQFQFTPPSQPYRYDVAFLVSQPILHSTGAALVPVAPLSCDDEEKSMYVHCLCNSNKIETFFNIFTVHILLYCFILALNVTYNNIIYHTSQTKGIWSSRT